MKASAFQDLGNDIVNALDFEEAVRLTPRLRSDLALFVGGDDPEDREEWVGMLQKASRSIACSVGVVVPGAEHEDGELLVAADRGPHGRAAVNRLALLRREALIANPLVSGAPILFVVGALVVLALILIITK